MPLREFSIGGAEVRVRTTNESGKIDLNAAPEGLLDALLTAWWVWRPKCEAKLSPRLPIGVTRTAWRGRQVPRTRNMQSQAGPYGAKDGPFESVDELQLVRGITPPLYRARTTRPDRSFAPRSGQPRGGL